MQVEKTKNEILCQQLQLLAERSVKRNTEELVKISIAMAMIGAEITVVTQLKELKENHGFTVNISGQETAESLLNKLKSLV